MYPGSSPCRKKGERAERFDHMHHDVVCVVSIIEILPNSKILSIFVVEILNVAATYKLALEGCFTIC